MVIKSHEVRIEFKNETYTRTSIGSVLEAYEVRESLAAALAEGGALHIGDVVFSTNDVLFIRVCED